MQKDKIVSQIKGRPMVSIECEGSEAALLGARCEIVSDKTLY
jgi:hypothetical protein